MDWEKYRREDNSIDLIKAFEEYNDLYLTGEQINFIRNVEKYQKIKSRQVAALVLAQLDYIFKV